MSDIAGWSTFVGAACLAIGGLVGGLIVTWFKSRGQYEVEIMKTQATLNADELRKKDAELIAAHHAIDVLTTRVSQLESNIKDIRDNNHNERDKWYLEHVREIKASMEREQKCHTESAELRGQLTVLTRLVSDRLPGPLAARPQEVTVVNEAPVPVEIHQ